MAAMAKTAVALNQFVKENLRGYFENEKGLFGFVDSERDLESLLLTLRSKHFEFSVRHSEERTGPKSFFFNFGDIPAQTTPFVINTATYKVCSYGNEYYKETQEKIKAKKQSEAVALGVGQSNGKERKPRKRKKTDCPGRMVIKELTFFPEYSVELKEDNGKRSRCRADMRKQLKKDIEIGKAIWKATRYFIHISHFHLHTGHPEMAAAELGYSIDVNKISYSQKKIKTGITTSWKDSSKTLRFPQPLSSNTSMSSTTMATPDISHVTEHPFPPPTSASSSHSNDQNVLNMVTSSVSSTSQTTNLIDITEKISDSTSISAKQQPIAGIATMATNDAKRTVDDLRKDCRTLAHAIARASSRVKSEESLIQAVGLMQHSFEILQFGCASLKGLAMKNSPAKKRPPLSKRVPIALKRTVAVQNIANLKKTKKTYVSTGIPTSLVTSGTIAVSNPRTIAPGGTHGDLLHEREDLNFSSEQNRAILNLPTVLTIDGSQLGLHTSQNATSHVIVDQGHRQILGRDHIHTNDSNLMTISNITALLQQAGVSLQQTLIVPTDISNQGELLRVRDELGLGSEQSRTLLNLPSVLAYDGAQMNIQSSQQLCNISNETINGAQLLHASKQPDQDVLGLTTSGSMSQTCTTVGMATVSDGQHDLTIAAEQTVSSIPSTLILDHGTMQPNSDSCNNSQNIASQEEHS